MVPFKDKNNGIGDTTYQMCEGTTLYTLIETDGNRGGQLTITPNFVPACADGKLSPSDFKNVPTDIKVNQFSYNN